MELLVVIAIIGVLSSVTLVSLNEARSRARDANRVAQVGQVRLALELYYDNHGEYPIDGCTTRGLPLGCGCVSYSGMVQDELVTGEYLSVIPEDPLHPDPCYQYQRNYVGVMCGGQALPTENFVLLFRGETSISHEYAEWGNGSGYRCVST